jgi:hypothetical protein
MPIRLVLMAALAATLTMANAEPVSVGHFSQVSLHGGGHVILRHGAQQSVSLTRGSKDVTSFTIQNGNELAIDTCGQTIIMCPVSYDLEVVITTPSIGGVSIHGGGEISTDGAFPAQDGLAAAVHGGGDIDVTAISARSVSAEVHGGGDIKVTATATLAAAVHGGGDIAYRGHPAVTQAVHGGGSIESE